MTEPLRNHGDHGDATAVYAVQAPQWHRASGETGVLVTVTLRWVLCGGISYGYCAHDEQEVPSID